jgi:hypothetical protein
MGHCAELSPAHARSDRLSVPNESSRAFAENSCSQGGEHEDVPDCSIIGIFCNEVRFALIGNSGLPCDPAAWAGAQDLANQIVGVWKLTDSYQKELESGATARPGGEKPTGSAIFTRGGYYTWAFINDGRKAPALPMTDADRAMLFSTMSFGAGTYKVEGSALVMRYELSWNQIWTGGERKAEMQITGKTLNWTSAPFRNRDDKQVVGIITMERVE